MKRSAEAVWLEQQIENTINDPDDSTWQSLPGGDTMNIAIKWNHGKDISLRGVKAIRKYVDLMGKLGNLTEYGSQEELKEESGRIKAVSSDNAAMISEKEFVPIFIPNLAGYQMKMHTDSGEEYCFTLTGLKAYYPNMSSMCGYGSDEWCFHCKYNGENYILRFCVDSGYGEYWDCALINKENSEQLEKLSVAEWLKLVLKSETKIFHLHPDTIDAAKNIVQATSSRCGPISDNGFYGR